MEIVHHIVHEPHYTAVKLITNDGLGIIEYSYVEDAKTANIYNFSVENNHRHQGIGTFLLKTALLEIEKLGKDASLFAAKKNKRLQGWYQKHGFKEDTSYTYDDELEEENYTYMIKRTQQ